MELLQLQYFQKTARLNHMTKAANELYISQPSLSKTIAQLEKQLGVKLFNRRGKYIELNEYGQVFLNSVDQMFAALNSGIDQINDMKKQKSGAIRLGILASTNLLPEILTQFHTLYPLIDFHLMQHFDIQTGSKECDLCIISGKHSLLHFTYEPLLHESIFLGVHEKHPFAERESVDLLELSGENFVSLGRQKSLRRYTDEVCGDLGFEPHIVYETDDPATVRGLVAAGQGVAFIPSVTWRKSTSDSIRLIPIKNPDLRRTIELCYPSGKYLSTASQLFCSFVKDFFQHMEKEAQEKE